MKIDYNNLSIYVADVSNDSAIEDLIHTHYPNIRVIKGKNVSWSHNNNEALKNFIHNSDIEYFAFVSDDIIFNESGTLSRIIEGMDSDKRIGLGTCRILSTDNEPQYSGIRLNKFGIFVPANINENRLMSNKEYLVGAFFIVKATLIRKIGFLDETYVMMGSEDTDLSERAYRAGYKCIYFHSVALLHIGSASTIKLSEEIDERWPLQDIKRNMRLNTYIFLLRYKKILIISFLIFDSFAMIFKLKKYSILKIFEPITLLFRAFKTYKSSKIVYL